MLSQGARFSGKWSGMPILVESLLGQGANGTVYRVRTRLGQAAMKVCNSSADIAMEWSLLTSLGPAAPSFPSPMIIDDGPLEAPFFYVMEWIPGRSLKTVIDSGDIALVMLSFERILSALCSLHEAGYAFCDLKPENVIVSEQGGVSIRFVDVGGVTEFGRSVRQYTPLCDRAFFGLGSRKAEPTYDLYALCLGIVTAVCHHEETELGKVDPFRRQKILRRALSTFPVWGMAIVFDRLAAGEFSSAQQLADAWKALPMAAKRPAKKSRRRANGMKHSAKSQSSGTRPGSRARKKQRVDWTEWVMWVSLTSAAVVCVAAWIVVLGWLP